VSILYILILCHWSSFHRGFNLNQNVRTNQLLRTNHYSIPLSLDYNRGITRLYLVDSYILIRIKLSLELSDSYGIIRSWSNLSGKSGLETRCRKTYGKSGRCDLILSCRKKLEVLSRGFRPRVWSPSYCSVITVKNFSLIWL